MVHKGRPLRGALFFCLSQAAGPSKATEFDTVVQDQIKKGQLDALAQFQKLGELARISHPTHEHYLPLLYAAGAARSTEMPRFFNTGFQAASISMRSVLWG